MGGGENNQKDFTVTLRERNGKTPLTESPTHPPPPKRAKSGKKASSSSSNNKKLFKNELSFMNDAKMAYARKRYISLAKLDVGIEKFVNEDDLDNLGVKDRVLELIQSGGFGGLWRLRGEIWEEILKEILATIIINDDEELCWVYFRGRTLKLSFYEFAEACGAYEGEGNEVGKLAPEKFWNGGTASKLGMNKDKFWSELCGQKGLKFEGGVSKITRVKDVSIKIVHRWLVTSICGRNARDGAVSERELTCLFGMVKGIDFDIAKLLIIQMKTNRSKKKGEVYGGLYLTHFIKRFFESLPGITIKPIEACTIRYLKGKHPGNTESNRIKDATPRGQPSELHPGNQNKEACRPHISCAEMEEQLEHMPFNFEPPPTMTPPPKYTHKEMNKIKERRAYDFRQEQMVQRRMLQNIMDNIKWMKEETIDFFEKAGHCFSNPPPACEGPPEINQEEFFRNFKREEEEESSHQKEDKSIEGYGGKSTGNDSTPVLLSPQSSNATMVLDNDGTFRTRSG